MLLFNLIACSSRSIPEVSLVWHLFNPRYVFYIVFVKRIKWRIVPHIIVQTDLPVDGMSINSHKTKLVCAIGCKTRTEYSGSQLVNLTSGET